MKKCKYRYKYYPCNEDTYKDYDHCILHYRPDIRSKEDIIEIQKLKHKKFKEKVSNADCNFDGIVIGEINFKGMEINSDVSFRDALVESVVFISSIISGNIDFTDAKILQYANFYDANINGNALFNNVKFPNKAEFQKFKVKYGVDFSECVFNGCLTLKKSIIEGRVIFNDTTIKDYIILDSASIRFLIVDHTKINGPLFSKSTEIFGMSIKNSAALFMNFDNSTIINDIDLHSNELNEGISFLETSFKTPSTQEKTCRYTKNKWEKLGNRFKADYYFYREMDAKRKQKPFYSRYLEWLLIQFPFAYGVYPERILFTFSIIFISFSLIFWQINGIFTPTSINYLNLINGIRFSFLTLIIPAYGIVSPAATNYGIYIIIESILGAFMWPLFIATFARKYMR
jgi:hypothetical protein